MTLCILMYSAMFDNISNVTCDNDRKYPLNFVDSYLGGIRRMES